MKTIGNLADLAAYHISFQKKSIESKCIVSGKTDGLKPAIVRIKKDNGQEMEMSGMVSGGIKSGRRYRGIGKVISVIRKGVTPDYITTGCQVIPAFRVA